ncbi:MAG: ribonuclease Z [Candidatus Bathyarchaeia archaeon]
MKVIFLGTSGSMPTQDRSSSSIAIRRKGEIIMFDCGEGTQRRMVATRIGFRRPTRIFITHLHGDHVLGLPGLIQTMTLLQRERSLHIYGPTGITRFIEAFSSVLGGSGFAIRINEIISEGIIYSGSEYSVTAIKADHDEPSWSYILEEYPRPGKFYPTKAKSFGVPEGPLWKRLQRGEDVKLSDGRVVRSMDVVDPSRRGLKLAYSGDTRPTEAFSNAAEGADLMIHEATFDDSLDEKAGENGHSTATKAAEVARAAGVGLLILTHISSRYPDVSVLLEEAKKVFQETKIAEDLMEIELPF